MTEGESQDTNGRGGRWRLALLVVGLAAVLAILFALRGGDDSGDAKPPPDDPTGPGRLRLEIGGDGESRPAPRPRLEEPADGPTEPPPSRPPPPAPEPLPEVRIHIVERGETLMDIAREHYGDASRWRDIQRANDLPSDRIDEGQRLIIP